MALQGMQRSNRNLLLRFIHIPTEWRTRHAAFPAPAWV
jgi:hypothetical protein